MHLCQFFVSTNEGKHRAPLPVSISMGVIVNVPIGNSYNSSLVVSIPLKKCDLSNLAMHVHLLLKSSL